MHSGYKNDKYKDYESHCGRNPYHPKDDNCCNQHHTCSCKHSENCVQDILEAILKAQRKAKEEDSCHTSCENSINDLLGKKRKVKKNTIPFILYCGCEPYKGTGVATYSCPSNKSKKFKCIQSFIFRIKKINGSCAVLELLAFKCDLKYTAKPNGECGLVDPCCQIDNKYVKDLQKTGVCINVDLSCICSVTCLPAIYL